MQKFPELTSPLRSFGVQLSPTPRGARLARFLATEQLRSWGVPLDPARLVVAELTTNAATHGRVPGRDFRLLMYVVAGTLRIEVTDTRDDRLPTSRLPAPDAESGRGLLLVGALADRWGVTPGLPPRKTVWPNSTSHRSPTARAPVPQVVTSEDHDGERNPAKPHPSRPPRRHRAHLTRAGGHHQLGWIREPLPALRPAQHNRRHATAPGRDQRSRSRA
ncbi:ATP-binding protein [Streptomyces bullii]|uniref:ATP-binding protein n=1 Tax=Streptomyces bullii TaxID=349910 RepID=A0ABW0V155_9ACTN